MRFGQLIEYNVRNFPSKINQKMRQGQYFHYFTFFKKNFLTARKLAFFKWLYFLFKLIFKLTVLGARSEEEEIN